MVNRKEATTEHMEQPLAATKCFTTKATKSTKCTKKREKRKRSALKIHERRNQNFEKIFTKRRSLPPWPPASGGNQEVHFGIRVPPLAVG